MPNKITPENCENSSQQTNESHSYSKRLGWPISALYIGRAGAGIVALPSAVVRCQFYPGLIILGLMATVMTTSAIMLGKCWDLVLRLFPEYRTIHCRKPYAEIGYRAFGPRMRTVVSLFVNFSQFGQTTVFLLLSAKNTRDFILTFLHVDIDYCLLLIMIAIVILPVTLLKSPCSFWPVIIATMISSVLAIILICIGVLADAGTCATSAEYPEFSARNYLYALGTMLFTYGGHPAYPTIQHDMKNPEEFKKAAIMGFLLMSMFNYIAVSLGGLVYGNSVRDCVLNSIQTPWIQHLANLSIALHCFCAITLIINPLNQEMEEFFHIPHHFGWHRILLRTAVLASVVVVAESVPSFGPVLNLYAGITVAFTAVIFPCIFYMALVGVENARKASGRRQTADVKPLMIREIIFYNSNYKLAFSAALILLFTTIGCVATVTAINSLMNFNFIRPCYLQWFWPSLPMTSTNQSSTFLCVETATNCCGPWQNISRYGIVEKHCTPADLHYY